MRRNYGSVKGAGWSRAFERAAAEVEPPSDRRHFERVAVEPPAVCDRSGDVGSTHIWPAGSTVGDWCLCGKRKRFTPFPGE